MISFIFREVIPAIMTGDGPKVYNPKPADQFFGKGTLNTEGPFVDVRRRVAPGLFTDIDRQATIINLCITLYLAIYSIFAL